MPPSQDSRSERSSLISLESQWVERIAEGDEKAFESMVLSYGPKLARFIWQFVRSTDVAEELVQQLFCNIWENRKNWKPEKSVKPYLYAAARNQAIGYLRHRRLETIWEGDEEMADTIQTSPYDELHVADFSKTVQQAIEDLPDRCRIIFRLHREDGLTYAEIAGFLGISIKTVETQMGRALKVLRSRLSDFLPGLLLFSSLFNRLH